MKLINVIALIDEFDDVVGKYILGSDIHMENAFDIFNNVAGLYPFDDENPYRDLLQNLTNIAEEAGVSLDVPFECCPDADPAAIRRYTDALLLTLSSQHTKREELEHQLDEDRAILNQLQPIAHIDVELDSLFHFKYIKVRFGQMPKDSYVKLGSYLGDYNAFFFRLDEDKDNVFGVYFAPTSISEKVDSIFASLYFKRVRISDRAGGIPIKEIERMGTEVGALEQRIEDLKRERGLLLQKEKPDIERAYKRAKYLHDVYECRRYAAHTGECFYLVGWVAERDVYALQQKIEDLPNVTLLIEDVQSVHNITPPTRLKNPKLFAPFEGFVEMYGIPAYSEVDPTIIFGITYTLMYGFMYGDVAHGVALFLFGLFMKVKKGSFIGQILMMAGACATVFGFLFGSILGNEELLPTLWYKPMHSNGDMTNTLLYAVGWGAVIISMCMILNMYNAARKKHWGDFLFSPNGLCGLLFFWLLIFTILEVTLGIAAVPISVDATILVLLVILLFMREPLTELLEGKKDWLPKNFGTFFLETFFEMFEVLLSYVTNLISFVRVGAYALIHAGMLMVVTMFVESTKGVPSYAILILGNIFVIGMEGLLVAIQVLRLEFYEMFSRFYSGNGKPFKPHHKVG